MRNVFLLGFVSFFTDISAEMVYPVVPLYLISKFGATPALIGFIEGIAESSASLLRVFSGYITDKYKKKRTTAFIGYSAGIFYKLILIFATSWYGVLGARVIDRMGKGIRTAPRDVMVSESAGREHLGRAFGIHKTLDMAGASIGIFTAYMLMSRSNGLFDYKKLFMISIVPAIFGLSLFLFLENKSSEDRPKISISFGGRLKSLDSRLKTYLFVVFIFTLGNSSNTFLLMRAKNMGYSDSGAVFLYFVYTLTASFLSMPFGRKSDVIGRKKLLVLGYIVFALVYFGFAIAMNKQFIFVLFIMYGSYTAIITAVERAFISEIAQLEIRGTMLGLHSTLSGIALFPASMIAGFLWENFGVSAPFLFGSGMALIAAGVISRTIKE
ncbi:MAG: MFS transporter [Proteocatella sp.]